MKKHKVEITETLQRTIVVEAETEDEAIEIVRTKYETSEITLNSDDHIDTEITTLTPFPVFKIGDKVKFTELQTNTGVPFTDIQTITDIYDHDTHYNYGTNEGEIYYAAELEKVE